MTELTTPTVELVHGRPVVLSVEVAKHFGKKHANVLRDIRKILSDLQDEARALNFEPSEYRSETALGHTRSYPAFHLSRDGFTLLAMGFTGKKAMQWKVRYIQAFNAMEAKLAGPPPAPPLPLSMAKQRKPLAEAVSEWCRAADIPRSEAWNMVKHRFQIKALKDLPVAWLQDAVDYVTEQINKHPTLPVFRSPSQAAAPALPKPKNLPNYDKLNAEAHKAWADYDERMHALMEKALAPFKGGECRMGSSFDYLRMEQERAIRAGHEAARSGFYVVQHSFDALRHLGQIG